MRLVKATLTCCCKVILLMMGIMATILGQGLYAAPQVMAGDIEQALLEGEWQTVKDKCGSTEKLESAPEIRAIKGHACLLLNQNNESLALFLSLAKEPDRRAFKVWTGKFAEKNPSSPVAQYLKGDALMRLDDLDGAMAAFNQSLTLNREYYPALNALGVVYCAKHQWEQGQKYFRAASKIAPKLADPYANLGTSWLYAKGLTQARSSFDQALAVTPAFALARNGQGCVNFLSGPGKWDKAGKDFSTAAKQAKLVIAVFNADLMNQAAVDAVSKASLYLQPEAILNWPELLKAIRDPNSVLYGYFSKVPVDDHNKRDILDRLNAAMDTPRFYDDHQKFIDFALENSKNATLAAGLKKLLAETRELRKKPVQKLNAYEKGKLRGLTRGLLNVSFPALFKETGKTKAGVSLSLTGDFVDSYPYKQSLSTSQLLAARDRMQDVYRHMANAVESIPIIGFLGKGWNQHLDHSVAQTNDILKNRGVGQDTILAGGLSTQELMVLFFKRDAWKPVNWFGLAYTVMPEGT